VFVYLPVGSRIDNDGTQRKDMLLQGKNDFVRMGVDIADEEKGFRYGERPKDWTTN
jgi:hypothetical protein